MSKIIITKPSMQWLFGGFGFHNSEATMTGLMSEKFKNERVLKTFREISPSFSRVFAVYADWTQEAMDAFADYYDQTFRQVGTLIYAVPGRMPHITEDFDIEQYSEMVAQKLDYLINVRNCTKIRYYCITNELSVGNSYAWFKKRLPYFKTCHEALYRAFRRHGLDVGLLATDVSGAENFDQMQWAAENMDEITECYCAHLYTRDSRFPLGHPGAYDYYMSLFTPAVMTAHAKEKRFILGESGIKTLTPQTLFPMRNDSQFSIDYPHMDNLFALGITELAIASINSGCFANAYWTMFDYPDPLIRENGDTPEEKARYNAARFSGHGMDIRYNTNGLVKWDDLKEDYSARAMLYTLGYMAKLFKKGSRVLESQWDDSHIRCCAVINPNRSVSVVILNLREEAQTTEFCLNWNCHQPARMYVYRTDAPPHNAFNDLQPHCGLVDLNAPGCFLDLPPLSAVFLTTDYVDRIPSTVRNIKCKSGILQWDACSDPEHCYYRVFRNGQQVASTVALEYILEHPDGKYTVCSVDKYGNAGK